MPPGALITKNRRRAASADLSSKGIGLKYSSRSQAYIVIHGVFESRSPQLLL